MSLGPLMIDLKGTALDEQERQWLRHPAVGGVILFSRNFADLDQLRKLVTDIHGIRDPSLLVAVDQEGGRVQRFHAPFTLLPPMASLGHLYDEDNERALVAARAFGWLMAAELRAVDVDLSFAPVVDLERGLAEVIGDRALHADARAVIELAVKFAAGMRQAGMAVTAKHYPTHAGVITDSHKEPAVDRRPFEALWDDLIPYRQLIETGVQAVMVAHVAFPEIDPRPASCSHWWIEEQLRGELGFAGAVISDDVAMAGAGGAGSFAGRTLAALEAGADMVLLCNSSEEIPPVLAALSDYVDPPGALRLMRLRGQGGEAWARLRASDEWRRAADLIEVLRARPELELEG